MEVGTDQAVSEVDMKRGSLGNTRLLEVPFGSPHAKELFSITIQTSLKAEKGLFRIK